MAFIVELWIEYGLGILTFLLRFFARWKVVGFRKFAGDDYFSFIAILCWTSDAVVVYIVNQEGSFVGLNEKTASELTAAQVRDYEIGSKALFTAWLTYITLIWSLKASLLFFYSRLTLQLTQQALVKIMAVVCFLTYIATFLVLFLHCTPIQKNWQIKPYAGDQCTLTVLNYLFVATANVITDAGILAIPIPLVYSVRLPLYRKIIIGFLLCSGIFIMTAALLRCILSLKANGHIDTSTIWGIRETFVSVLVVSAPAIRPIFSKSRWINSNPDPALRACESEEHPDFPQKFRRIREMARLRGLELTNIESDGTVFGLSGIFEKSKNLEDLERGECYNIETLQQSLRQSNTHSSAYAMDISRGKSPDPMLSNGNASNSTISIDME